MALANSFFTSPWLLKIQVWNSRSRGFQGCWSFLDSWSKVEFPLLHVETNKAMVRTSPLNLQSVLGFKYWSGRITCWTWNDPIQILIIIPFCSNALQSKTWMLEQLQFFRSHHFLLFFYALANNFFWPLPICFKLFVGVDQLIPDHLWKFQGSILIRSGVMRIGMNFQDLWKTCNRSFFGRIFKPL